MRRHLLQHPILTVLMLIACRICQAAASRGPGVRVLENQTFSKTLFILWDVRVNTRPEFNELATLVRLTLDPATGNLTVAFNAFNRSWRIAAAANEFLLPRTLPAEVRGINATDGDGAWQLDQSLWQPIRNRLYLGTVDAGTNEQGWAALVYTGESVRAYLTTNINDYMLNAPIANQTALEDIPAENSAGRTRGSGGRFPDLDLASPDKFAPNAGGNDRADGGSNSTTGSVNKHLPRVTDFVNLGPLPRPMSGLDLYAEIAVFVDQTWVDSVSIGFGVDRDAALVYTAELLHYVRSS